MIQEIKTIVENYINNAKLCGIMQGTVIEGGDVKINDKLIIPNELIYGNKKHYTYAGCHVRLLRNHGGREFFLLEILGIYQDEE